MALKFAITPCPNDTFSYHTLITKALDSDFEFVFDDIEGLNLSAAKGEYPITKMSFAAFLLNRDKYELLDAGAALGIGTGPVLVTANGKDFDASKLVAVPGLNTTGALLLKFFLRKGVDMRPVYFRDIIGKIRAGEFDSGVLIHEGRFVCADMGMRIVSDLGAYWTEKTGLPVPLGCICVRRDFSERKAEIESLIRSSIDAAFARPEDTYGFVRGYAQYLDDDVLKKHIYAFVNEYSKDISQIRGKLLENIALC